MAAEEDIRIAVTERAVRTQAEAKGFRFPGSPTIRVARRDIEPEIELLNEHGLG